MHSNSPMGALSFRQRPGCHERHLRRKLENPLFPQGQRRPSQADLSAARHRDNEELARFTVAVQQLVGEIGKLDDTVDSTVILDLKARADRYYEQCTGLAGDQQPVKEALTRLLTVMMSALEKGAGGDARALAELRQEQLARDMHFALLELPLTGDLLREHSPISAEELVPTLLSEPVESLAVILSLFEPAQISLITADGRALIDRRRQEGLDMAPAERRLSAIEAALADAEPD